MLRNREKEGEAIEKLEETSEGPQTKFLRAYCGTSPAGSQNPVLEYFYQIISHMPCRSSMTHMQHVSIQRGILWRRITDRLHSRRAL